jgi:hypothetical protein
MYSTVEGELLVDLVRDHYEIRVFQDNLAHELEIFFREVVSDGVVGVVNEDNLGLLINAGFPGIAIEFELPLFLIYVEANPPHLREQSFTLAPTIWKRGA